MIIESRSNKRIKELVRLKERSKYRLSQGLILVEGVRELTVAWRQGFEVRELYLTQEVEQEISTGGLVEIISDGSVRVWKVDSQVLLKVTPRALTQGVVAVVERPEVSKMPAKVEDREIFLYLDGIEKPGNIGAICRSAEAMGVSGILASRETADFYSPAAIRASLGTVFAFPFWIVDGVKALSWAETSGMEVVVMTPEAKKPLWEYQVQGPVLVVVGSEQLGVGQEWKRGADYLLSLPMLGEHDSLNVSVAAAIFLYELQRGK